jgi:hypothetical protein
MPMANLLLIISKEYPERYEFLKKAFASRKEVEVVLDRRAGQKPVKAQDRRAHMTDTQLRSHGWVLVRRLPGSAKATAPQIKVATAYVTTTPSAVKPAAPQAKAARPAAKRPAAKVKRAVGKKSGVARRRRARA